MSLVVPKKQGQPGTEKVTSPTRSATLRSWLLTWEIYLIVIFAAFLRLYGIGATEFDDDQANIFRMAHDAVSHGMLVATSNVASIHIYNPPAIIYLLMLPAAISSDPLWGAVMVALLMTVSVVLTYIFTRRYYGRVAGTIAALLYATASRPIFYSRFMWNQNLLPIFTILFMFALFWGIVERRKGWLFPALFLLGVLVQLHASGILMAAPLVVAIMLAPRTIRWRDLALGILSLLLIYLPYALWEFATNFIDVHTLLTITKQPILIDDKAWNFYQLFLSPYDSSNPPAKQTLLGSLVLDLSWLQAVMTGLVIGGALLALVSILWANRNGMQPIARNNVVAAVLGRIKNYGLQFRASPYRCGLLVLLLWQVVPLLVLTRHSIGLYAHYLIILLPGAFILIGFLLGKIIEWCEKWGGWTTIISYTLYLLASILIIAQFVGSTASVLDSVRGNFNDFVFSHPYYNDLHSLQAALAEADQVAQQRHLNRVYISTDPATQAALRYLSEQMRTPTTVFDDAKCAVLPSVASGPVVMLLGPYNSFTPALVSHFATMTLLAEPKRLGGAPFKLYIVTPKAVSIAGKETFGHDLQLLDAAAHTLSFNGASWLVTRWSLLRTAQPGYRTIYGYHIAQFPGSANNRIANSLCYFTSMRAGDQLVIASQQSAPLNSSLTSSSVTITAQSFSITPYILSYGPITFETYRDITSPGKTLYTINGEKRLFVPVARF